MKVSLLELARQGLSSLSDGYDLLAPNFDETPFRTPDSVVQAMGAYFRSSAPFVQVLDLGCGTGAMTEAVAPYVNGTICGIDQSPGMLGRYMEATQQLSWPWVQFEYYLGDAKNYRSPNRFDLVVSFGVLGHIMLCDHQLLFENLYHSLRPGGRFVTAMANYGLLERFKRRPQWQTAAVLTISRLFDGAMWLRNQLIWPPFPMYYRNLDLGPACERLARVGFMVEIQAGKFDFPFEQLQLVVAHKP